MGTYLGKRARTSSWANNAMQLSTGNSYSGPGRLYSSGGYYNSRRGYSSRYKRRRSTRNKWSAFNTYTNPVYPRPEVKYTDTTQGTLLAPLPITSAGITPLSLNNVGMSAPPINRIGAQIATKSIYYNLVFNFGASTVPIVIRHVLVWDRQSNGVLPAYADVFSATGLLITSPLQLTNRNRFVILADDRLTLSPQGDNIRFLTGYRKINQLTTFEPTGTNNMPYTGNLVVMMVSDEPTTGTTQPTYYGTWRCRFIDP